MPLAGEESYEFGTFRLDTALSRLERGGEAVPIPPRAFDLLLLFVRKPGRILTKSELMQALWPEVFVEEANLTQHVFTLRKALGVQATGQPYIETVPRRGYTFTASVRAASSCPGDGEAGCRACGHAVPEQAAFCPSCGSRLAAAVSAPSATATSGAPAGRPAHDGERRRGTILDCGVANAAALAEDLGAGGMQSLVRRLFDVALEEVCRYDGVITERHAASFVAVFGARATHEDDARRAVLSAVDIARRALDLWPGGPDTDGLVTRIGLDTGPLVIGRMGSESDPSYTAVGEATRGAALLQQLAPAGSILLSEATRRAAEAAVETEPVSLDTPMGRVRAHRLAGLRPLGSFGQTPTGRAASPFVGRHRELAILEDLARQALAGDGQVVAIVGEPGMGKSRLVAELARTRVASAASLLEGRSVSYGSSVPFLPIVDLVRTQGGGGDVSAESMTDAVERRARELELPPDAAQWLLRLLGIDSAAAASPARTPEAAKARTFEVLRLLLLRASMRQPLLVVVEDLHWIDRTSEEFLESLVERLPGARLCLVVTARSGYRAPWMDRSYATQITLRPLGPSDSADLVGSVAGDRPLARAVSEAILARAEGNPFFLEELTRTVLDHGPEARQIPGTIQAVIMARVDHLSPRARHLLQVASVIGREVPRRLLGRVWVEAGSLEHDLGELCRLEFLYERPGEGAAVVFKHALTQDVAYDSLLAHQRAKAHERVARALEALHAESLDEVGPSLAYHYARTDLVAESVVWSMRVADQAARVYANEEAVLHLQRAARRVERLADPAERDRILVQIALRHAHSLYFLGRFAESVDVLLHQEARLARLRDPALAAAWSFWLAHMYSRLGDQGRAASCALRAVEVSERIGDEVTRAKAHGLLALEGHWTGDAAAGVAHGDEAIRVLRGHPQQGWYLGMAHFYVALNHLHVGAFAAALDAAGKADETGRAMGDPRLRCYSAFLQGWVEASRGNAEAAIALCETSRDRAPDRVARAYATMLLGYATLEHGEPARARALLEPVAGELEGFGFPQWHGWARTQLAEALRLEGRRQEATGAARRALEVALQARYWYACGIARRVLAAIAADAGRLDDAQADLAEAVSTFERIGAAFECARARIQAARLARTRADMARARAEIGAARRALDLLDAPVYRARAAEVAADIG